MPASTPARPDDYHWRLHNPGRILSNALRRFEERVLALMDTAGHGHTRRSHVNLTRHLDLQGTRITELARRAAMTNAAMTELIDQCEALGLVERAADPTDGRARIVRFTPTGLRWLDDFGRAVAQAEAELAAQVGPQMLARSMRALTSYAQAARDDAPASKPPAPTPPAPARARPGGRPRRSG